MEKEKIVAIENFLVALKRLKQLNILNSRKDFTSQIGEWLIAQMYGAELAVSGNQKDWDIRVGEKKIQVKSHSKAQTSKRKDTSFKYDENSSIDIFIIVIFEESYKVKKIFEIPFKIALELKKKHTKEPVITWSTIPEKYIVNLKEKCQNNELLKSFVDS